MVEYTERMIHTWVNSEERPIHRDMTELALEIINKTMFGHTITEDVEKIGEIIEMGSRRNIQQAKRDTLSSFYYHPVCIRHQLEYQG
ncbi:hypothetical protein [Paenibacillus sp. yr247]|uniref:hypothetical protein n=1 Tax=Paenibacillus sp. yr247 TaxID=1761880 RepID=UPI000B862512|nr:hypothetical protein [Paenibacillus sp. yr247]